MAKSMRTAFIRISAENIQKSGGDEKLVCYTKSQVYETLKQWAETANIEYWMVEHEADDEVTLAHYHVVIRFKSPMPFETVKKRFPHGNIQSARNIKNTVQYLIHMNDPEKRQYEWTDVLTNCQNMAKYMVQSNSSQEVTLKDIMGKIDRGEIREYNQFTAIPIEIWSKHKTRIENALTYYRERICMDKSREITVLFFSGDTGTGKTTFAKQYCQMARKSYCISSSANDPMQDYKGEDVLILDDMRDDAYTFTDLLKILDNHTKSTVRSRYHNKAFIGETIIITSYKPLTDWYTNIPDDAIKQLYRRVGQCYEFTKKDITVSTYNDETRSYEFTAVTPNMITMKFEEKKKKSLEVLEAMGVQFSTEMKDKLENVTEEDFVQLGSGDDNPFAI